MNAGGPLSAPQGLGMATCPIDHRHHNFAASSTGGHVADSEDESSCHALPTRSGPGGPS
jgi:hypothetical protein